MEAWASSSPSSESEDPWDASKVAVRRAVARPGTPDDGRDDWMLEDVGAPEDGRENLTDCGAADEGRDGLLASAGVGLPFMAFVAKHKKWHWNALFN